MTDHVLKKLDDGASEYLKAPSPVSDLVRDMRQGMRELRDLVIGSTVYGLLPTLSVYLSSSRNQVMLPLAESIAIISGSAGAVLGYIFFRPSEEDREKALAHRRITPIKVWILMALVFSVASHVYLWRCIERAAALQQLIAVSLVSFTSMLFFGLIMGAMKFLLEQRSLWTHVGRSEMHKAIAEDRSEKLQEEQALKDALRGIEEYKLYMEMFTESRKILDKDPENAHARGNYEEALDWLNNTTAARLKTDAASSKQE